MEKTPAVILEDSAFFKRGQVIETYEKDDDGIIVEGRLVPSESCVLLTEHLTPQDEQKIKDLIRQQFKLFFWNLYTKSSINLGT